MPESVRIGGLGGLARGIRARHPPQQPWAGRGHSFGDQFESVVVLSVIPQLLFVISTRAIAGAIMMLLVSDDRMSL